MPYLHRLPDWDYWHYGFDRMNVGVRHVDRALSPASVDYLSHFCLAGCPVPEQPADCRLFDWLLPLVVTAVDFDSPVVCWLYFAPDRFAAGR